MEDDDQFRGLFEDLFRSLAEAGAFKEIKKDNSAGPLPASHHQWRLSLWEVKLYLIHRNYKKCLAKIELLLSYNQEKRCDPSYDMYLHFYWGLCQDAVARLKHPLSPNKIPLLKEADEHFRLAAEALSSIPTPPVAPADPIPTTPDDDDDEDDDDNDSQTTVHYAPGWTATSWIATGANDHAGGRFRCIEQTEAVSERIKFHMESVNTLIQKTLDVQAKHDKGGPSLSGVCLTKQDRIEKLRAAGYKRDRVGADPFLPIRPSTLQALL